MGNKKRERTKQLPSNLGAMTHRDSSNPKPQPEELGVPEVLTNTSQIQLLFCKLCETYAELGEWLKVVSDKVEATLVENRQLKGELEQHKANEQDRQINEQDSDDG